MKIILLALLTLSACDCGYDRLEHKDNCDAPCYGGDTKQAGFGVCHLGRVICHGTKAPTCEDWGAPTAQACNGLDNDCDGQLDTIVTPCHRACGNGIQGCMNGQTFACTAPMPEVEKCDGIDNDCDGVVDNIAQSPCYTGPLGTETLGDCHAGTLHCDLGQLTCIGEKTPSNEICDKIDNNCNGFVDEDLAPNPLKVCVAITTDAVMATSYNNAIKPALINFAHKEVNTKFCLIQMEDTNYAPVGLSASPILVSDFTDAAGFEAALNTLTFGPLYGAGDCPTLDALHYTLETLNGATVPYGLNWTPTDGSDKMMIVFLDEEPQVTTDLGLWLPYLTQEDSRLNVPILLFADLDNAPLYKPYVYGTPQGQIITLGGHEGGGLPQATIAGIEANMISAAQRTSCGH